MNGTGKEMMCRGCRGGGQVYNPQHGTWESHDPCKGTGRVAWDGETHFPKSWGRGHGG